jgi:hypothetical protein
MFSDAEASDGRLKMLRAKIQGVRRGISIGFENYAELAWIRRPLQKGI